ncbi:MAG: hypothetical protein ACN4GW_05850 [Desulforhopalus sp.]
MKPLPLLITLLTLLLSFCTTSYAHKVRIFAWEEGENIITESKFSGGKTAKNVTVSVIDQATGQELLSGTTDSEGLFRFPVPKTAGPELKIVVDGGDGHKNSWKHSLETDSPAFSPQLSTGHKGATTNLKRVLPPTPPEMPQQVIDPEQLTILIEEALDRKLGPIKRSLAENAEKGPSIQDIIGGIGYIFGLAGLAAYMRFRRKEKE